jgi:hypothetical protein
MGTCFVIDRMLKKPKPPTLEQIKQQYYFSSETFKEFMNEMNSFENKMIIEFMTELNANKI